MPKLWSETIERHRQEVRDTVIRSAAALVDAQGLGGVTMQQVADQSGIGRATLYKYFPDLESIVLAWHDQQIKQHLEQLVSVRDQTTDLDKRLPAVLHAYAFIVGRFKGHHDSDLSLLLHRGQGALDGRRRLNEMVEDLLAEAAKAGLIRGDARPRELAAYCIRSLAAARDIGSRAGIARLVDVVLDGLRQQPD